MKNFKIGKKIIGKGQPVFIVAEMSGNHNGSLKRAKEIIKLACEAGVDAVKVQTYLPEILTFKSNKKWFQINEGPWKGKTLYDLYSETYTPWEWLPELKKISDKYNVSFFSSVFDETSIDFLEKIKIPAYKIASFELCDAELLKKVAKTKKPIIISRGMASLEELKSALSVLRKNGAKNIAVLHCVSSYPADPKEINLLTMPDIKKRFDTLVGLSDHTLGISASVCSVALGASIIEKHFTLKRADGGADAGFSLEPLELRNLVKSVREAEKSIGKVFYGAGREESKNKIFRRSLFVINDIKKGEIFSSENIRSIRPGYGLSPNFLPKIIGKHAKKDIEKGNPLNKKDIA